MDFRLVFVLMGNVDFFSASTEEKERGQARLPDPELNFVEYDY